MNALIVDDERLARNELRRLLREHPEVTVIGEAVDADDALQKIATLRPDVLFLDIQMPGKDGFALLEELERAPLVIFTTAYDEHALRAFEVSALDYLLKPIDPKRLAAAVARIRDAVARRTSDDARPLDDDERIFVKDGERCWFVPLRDIFLFESNGNYTRIHFGANRPHLLRTLNYIESRLDPRRFFRASRKHIINLRFVESVEPSLAGGLIVRLAGGAVVEVSRRQAQRFREMTSL